jgi:hypothetical protein
MKYNIKLQSRDYEVFTFLYRNHYATEDQLHQLLFNHGTVQYGYRRLLKLRQAGYIRQFQIPGLEQSQKRDKNGYKIDKPAGPILALTLKSLAILALNDLPKKPANVPPKPNTPNHAYLLLHDLSVTSLLVDLLVATQA